MSELVIPVVSKHRLGKNEWKKLYVTPGDKSHGIVDVTMFFDMPDGNKEPTHVTFVLSDSNDLTEIKNEDVLINKVLLGAPEVSPELGKIIVGANQNLYAMVDGEGPVNLRVSGLEENNPLVKKAGKLAGLTISEIGVHELYRVDTPLVTYGACTLSISNMADHPETEIYVWVTDNVAVTSVTEDSRLVDRVAKLQLEPGETAFVENMILAPNERVYVSTKTTGITFNLNGMLIAAV